MTDAGAVAGPRRWWILGLLSLVELLGMSVWLTASAVGRELQVDLGLASSQAAWLTTIVQLGFVAGTALAAVLNLADIVRARTYLGVSCFLAAASNLALLGAPGFGVALTSRFATGFFLAGVYPPAMKMAATWFREGRGFAIGTIVGALTLGKALPYLLHAGEGVSAAAVIGATSVGAVVAGLAILGLYRDGPFVFPRRPFSWRLVREVVRDRPTRLATGGYLGHMWELYAVWTSAGLFFLEYFSRLGAGSAERWASLMAFVLIGSGALGSALAGVLADRWGRERVASAALAASGTCSLVIGWTLGWTPWVVVPLAVLWGLSVVADSAQFSALVTEVCPPHAAGTALTLQTSAGFLLTMVTVQGTPVLADLIGWGWALSILAIGPVFGIRAMASLESLRAQQRPRPG